MTMIAALALLAAAPAGADGPGTVAVTLVTPAADQAFADAVGQALGARDFTLLPGHSRFIAEVSVAHQAKGLAAVRVPKEHVAASPLAVSVPLPSRKTMLRDLVATTLTVRLVTRDGHRPVWSAAAMTVQPDGAPIAAKLAQAVVAAYPRTVEAPVAIP